MLLTQALNLRSEMSVLLRVDKRDMIVNAYKDQRWCWPEMFEKHCCGIMIEQKTLREIIDAKICRGAFSIRIMMLTISYICFTAIAPNNNIQRKTIKVFVCLFVVYLLYTCVRACVYTVYIIFHILEISLANKSHL